MRRLIGLLLVGVLGSTAHGIDYTLVNDPDSDKNQWRCTSNMWTRVWHTALNDEDDDFQDSGTQTGHTSGLWDGEYSSDTSSYTAFGGTTVAHADVTPEVLKDNTNMTNPAHGSQIDYDNAVSVYNPASATYQGIAQGYGLAWTTQSLYIDTVTHGQVSGKILTSNYVLMNLWSGTATYASLDNSQPWVYVKFGNSWVSATWDATYTRWRIQGSVQDNVGDPTAINQYDSGHEFGVMSGIVSYYPTGVQGGIDNSTEIEMETRCGNLALPNNYWLDTMRTSNGGIGGSPLTADSDLLLYCYIDCTVHD